MFHGESCDARATRIWWPNGSAKAWSLFNHAVLCLGKP